MLNTPFSQIAANFFRTLGLWAARGRERRDLEDLPDYMLRDLGLTREQAMEEATRPPWSGSSERLGKIPHRAHLPAGARRYRVT